ncbi:MAG: response regulator [Bacteroidota bacterium]
MKILVCEDNVLTLRTIEFALKRTGFEVVKAVDGDEGIRILDDQKIDVVITDINMPYTKGLELVLHVNKKFGKKIPVIIISSITHKETKDHALELGAKGYLTKPFDLDALVDMVNSLTPVN